MVSGKRIDDVCEKNQMKLNDENKKVQELTKERDQLKALNNKLLEKVSLLQSIVDQQASANTFYYNYPPKPDESNDTDNGKKENQTDKVRKIFED